MCLDPDLAPSIYSRNYRLENELPQQTKTLNAVLRQTFPVLLCRVLQIDPYQAHLYLSNLTPYRPIEMLLDSQSRRSKDASLPPSRHRVERPNSCRCCRNKRAKGMCYVQTRSRIRVPSRPLFCPHTLSLTE